MVWQIDFTGKCMVVTGGNRGIGLAISRQCAKAGAKVAIVYRSSTDAPQVAEQIAKEFDVDVKAYKCDVSDQNAIRELFGRIYKEVAPIGGVVCNAGVAVVKPALDMTREDYNNQMDPNLWGVFNCAQAAALLWKEHGYKNGRLVFVSSMSATIANRDVNQCFYNPSKGALTMLAKSLAMEWADMGILVNCLSPGFVDTDLNQSLRDDPKRKEYYENMVMLKRISHADEQAGAAVFFLSDYASYVTASELIVDGGTSSW